MTDTDHAVDAVERRGVLRQCAAHEGNGDRCTTWVHAPQAWCTRHYYAPRSHRRRPEARETEPIGTERSGMTMTNEVHDAGGVILVPCANAACDALVDPGARGPFCTPCHVNRKRAGERAERSARRLEIPERQESRTRINYRARGGKRRGNGMFKNPRKAKG
jgi:hypothetical protein